MTRRSPLDSIRSFCVDCLGGSPSAVTDCNDTACPFLAYRHGVALPRGHHAPLRACKRYCAEYCQAGAGRDEVANCQGDEAIHGPCPMFPFRMGRNPNISEETRAARSKRALKLATKGTFGFQKAMHSTPVQPPKIDANAKGGL